MNATPHLYLIGIGSNRRHVRFGRPQGVVEAAIARLDTDFMLFDASPILLNPAFGGAGRDFANAAAMIESELDPEAMLVALKSIERDFGRKSGRRWAERVLDLDILAWSGGRFRSRTLIIPHSGFADRPSAIIPSAAIAPNWPLPSGVRVRHLLVRSARA